MNYARLKMLTAMASVLACSMAAQASQVSWDFNIPGGSVSGPHAYLDTTNTYSITAMGFTTTLSPGNASLGQTWGPGAGFDLNTGTIAARNLYGKTSSPDETGLGLDGLSGDHEIQTKSFIQLDLADVIAHNLTDLTMIITSVQSNEGFFLWGSDTAGTPGSLLKIGANPGSGGDIQTFLVPHYGDYRYISISANGGDVLIGNGLCASVPEPATASLLLGIAVMGMRSSRRRRIVHR